MLVFSSLVSSGVYYKIANGDKMGVVSADNLLGVSSFSRTALGAITGQPVDARAKTPTFNRHDNEPGYGGVGGYLRARWSAIWRFSLPSTNAKSQGEYGQVFPLSGSVLLDGRQNPMA
ncbi:carboxypeptidase cpdS precursor [Apiospora arundinis]